VPDLAVLAEQCRHGGGLGANLPSLSGVWKGSADFPRGDPATPASHSNLKAHFPDLLVAARKEDAMSTVTLTPVQYTHIFLDNPGRAWIDDTNIKVIEVALDKLADGWSAEEIHEGHNGYLSMAQIHAALAYYHDHKAEFDAEIDRQVQEYEALRAAQGKDTPLHKKLRAAGKIP
jgi:uncharacterized protein (DUF433 family)